MLMAIDDAVKRICDNHIDGHDTFTGPQFKLLTGHVDPDVDPNVDPDRNDSPFVLEMELEENEVTVHWKIDGADNLTMRAKPRPTG